MPLGHLRIRRLGVQVLTSAQTENPPGICWTPENRQATRLHNRFSGFDPSPVLASQPREMASRPGVAACSNVQPHRHRGGLVQQAGAAVSHLSPVRDLTASAVSPSHHKALPSPSNASGVGRSARERSKRDLASLQRASKRAAWASFRYRSQAASFTTTYCQSSPR